MRTVIETKQIKNTTKGTLDLEELFAIELRQTFLYPASFIKERSEIKIIQSKPKIVVGILKTSNGNPYLAAVISPDSYAVGEIKLHEIMEEFPLLGLGIVTDAGKNTKYYRKNFFNNEIEYVPGIEPYLSPSEPEFLYRNEKKNNSSNRKLVPLTSKVEDVFFQIHSYIRDIDGLHPEDALDELSKLLHLKILDERYTADDDFFLTQKNLFSTNEEFAATLRNFYIKNLDDGQAKRQHIKLSTAALSKSMEILQEYSILKSNADIKGQAFQKVLGTLARSGMGQYLTPDPIVKFMVSAILPKKTDNIIDPFCGSAHFLVCCAKLNSIDNNDDYKQKLVGIEKNERMMRVAKIDLELHEIERANLICKDALLDFSNYSSVGPERFDIVLTNPPFGSLLSESTIKQLANFEFSEGKKTTPLEILGLERSMQLLRPGGKIGIVLPEGILANRNTRHVRNWLLDNAKIRGIISLPIETFSPFGANIKTSILFARKWMAGETKDKEYKIFLGQCDSVGYDAAGRPKNDSDLDSLKKEFFEFIKENEW